MNRFQDADTVSALLHQLAGFASVCWENPAGAGVFQSEQAHAACLEAEERLREIQARP